MRRAGGAHVSLVAENAPIPAGSETWDAGSETCPRRSCPPVVRMSHLSQKTPLIPAGSEPWDAGSETCPPVKSLFVVSLGLCGEEQLGACRLGGVGQGVGGFAHGDFGEVEIGRESCRREWGKEGLDRVVA